MRGMKKFAVILAIVMIVIIVGCIGLHYYLLTQNRYLVFHLGGRQLLKLGTSLSLAPQDIEAGFNRITNAAGTNVRIPKYIHDVLVSREEHGVFYATEIGGSEERRYRWTDSTGYICVAPDMATVAIENPVDPKKDLANYVFVFYGGDFRGNYSRIGLLEARNDLVPGDPAKLYLKTDQPGADGTYELLNVALFTSHETCTLATEPSDAPSQP